MLSKHPQSAGLSTHRRVLLVAIMLFAIAFTASGAPLFHIAETAHAQSSRDLVTLEDAQRIVDSCSVLNIVTVELPDGSVTRRNSLPQDFSEATNGTAYECSWLGVRDLSDKIPAAVAFSHVQEAWADIYQREGHTEISQKLFLLASGNLQRALNRIPATVDSAAERLDLSLVVGESLRRIASKLDASAGIGVVLDTDEVGRAVLLNNVRVSQLISQELIQDIEDQIELGFAHGAPSQAANDAVALAGGLALRGDLDNALAVLARTADRLAGHADAPRLFVQASELATRTGQCGLAEEMWNQAALIDSSLGDYTAAPACRDLENDPVLAPARDVSELVDENRVTSCANNHRNSDKPWRSTASADVQRAQCLVLESARIDIDNAVALLQTARGLASGDPVLQAVTFATAAERYGRGERRLDAVAAYQAAAEQMLTADIASFANSIHQFGGSGSLKILVAPVGHQRQAAQYYRSAAAQAFNAGVTVKQAQMLELAGETLRQLALDLQRPSGYSDEDFDSLKDTLLESSRNDLHPAARILRDSALDYDRAADLFLKALELDTEILPILTRKGQTSQALFSLPAFQDLLEDSPEGTVNIYDLLAQAELIAITFAAKPEALQPNVARQARRFFAALATVARDRLANSLFAEELLGQAGDAIIRPVALTSNDTGTARADYNNAGLQAEESGSCVRALEWYEKGAAVYLSTNPNITPNKCSRDSLRYGEGVPLTIIDLLDELGEVIEDGVPSGVQPTATAVSPRPAATPTRATGGTGLTQPTATPDSGAALEDVVIDEISPPSEGSGGSCNAPNHNGTISAGHIGMLATPLGLLALSLWRRRGQNPSKPS